ncbi:serine/threonine-protein kinase HipA [Pseudomonas mucidolens]|uniref:Serine/threonine-protein kinase HipA n=2 Tax=Pseudomonas mucidolens TaxID=46679 RepID=A0A1H2NU24_9PSED|nr:serine/threonine-protein kinase HipA [Pseudomonas mucidolens]SQH37556.1 HipA domain-containing protein [Pseudomonas mucidolens]
MTRGCIKLQIDSSFKLTVQVFEAGRWQDAMLLTFVDLQNGFAGPCRFGYESAYLTEHLDHIDTLFAPAVSVRVRPIWGQEAHTHAPAFLYDIAPAGAAKRFLLGLMGQAKPEGMSTDLFLLAHSTPAPIGHMRIKESVRVEENRPAIGFSRKDVVDRDNRFLEYAYEQGAAIGGATGAGGEAPKLLLTQSHDGLLYPDAVVDDAQVSQHWFIKFARHRALQRDQDILRSEYHYYKALQALGIETVAIDGLALEEASRPSLWMHRFDRKVGAQGVERLPVESLYSAAGVIAPGSSMDHMRVVQMLVNLWRSAGQEAQVADLVADYLRRDLLNKILGNSDNHGRNTSIIREHDRLRLAPIYDLAPMVMDDEGITRTTKWPSPLEVAGDIDWRGVCDALSPLVDPEKTFEGLRQDAERLRALPDILLTGGLPEVTWRHPRIALRHLDQRLTDWGLR